jgi:hypothetical protein
MKTKQISSQARLCKMGRGEGHLIRLTASATYYYRGSRPVLARPVEHATLRKCSRLRTRFARIAVASPIHREFEVVIMIAGVTEEMHGSDRWS